MPRFFISLVLVLFGCATETPDPSADVLATGAFVDKGGQHTAGTYRIERSGDDFRLVLESDFETDEGPDLHVLLSPVAVDSAENDNVAETALVIAPLQEQTGEQVYAIRGGVDLSAYRSVLIHCIEFSHLYGAAPL